MAARIAVEIVGDSRSLERAFARSSRSAKKFEGDVSKTSKTGRRGFGLLGKAAGLAGGLIGTYGLATAARAAFGEMADAQKVSAQTAAVLKSTGKAAGVSAKQVDEMANALMKKSGVDDEAIKSGENLLLTFTNIRNEAGKGNDIFNQATSIMLDMSTALGQDTKQSAIQLGKALNDPIKGVTALRRVGVSFTKSQTDQIKALEESGHHLEAQKLILAELRKEFGGSAEAAGKTFAGQLNILRETLLNLGGSIAQILTPTIQKLVQQLVNWLNNSKNQKQVLDTVKGAAQAVALAIKTLVGAFQLLSRAVGGSRNAMILLIGAFAAFKVGRAISAVLGLARSFGVLATRERAAAGASAGMRASLLGKAGLVAAVGIAAYEITKLILKLTGLDKKLRSVGAAVADALGAGGTPEPDMPLGLGVRLRRQAVRLRGRGMSEAQTRAILARRFPAATRHDIAVASHISIQTMNVYGVHNVKQFEAELQRRAKQRAHARRGTR